MAADEGVWIYKSDAGAAAVVQTGLARAKSESWVGDQPAEKFALFGLLLETSRIMGALAGSYTETTTEQGVRVDIQPAPVKGAPEERKRAAVILYRTIELLAQSGRSSQSVATIETQPADVGAWPLVAAVVVVGIAQAAAIGYCAHQASLVIDRQLSRRNDLKKLVAEHAHELELIGKHIEREKAAGKPLPLDEPIKSSLNATLARQNAIATKQESPLSSGLPALPDPSGFGWGVVLTIAAGAYLLWST